MSQLIEMSTLNFGDGKTYEIVDKKSREEMKNKINNTDKGKANGVATLNKEGKVPQEQLPPMNESIELGDTKDKAYPGDKGKIAYDHAQLNGKAFVSGLYKITTNKEGHVTSATPVTKEDIVNLGIPENDTTYESEGENSFATNDSNTAIAPYSDASGFSNRVGSKAFTIVGVDKENKTYTLDSTDGLEVGDVYSVHVLYTDGTTRNEERYGTITAIENNVVTVDKLWCEKEFANREDVDIDQDNWWSYIEANTFRVVAKPDVGNIIVGHGAHAEGSSTKALAKDSHAEGYCTLAYGYHSHAEGRYTEAGFNAHAEGNRSKAIGRFSHAEGEDTLASGERSHAEGSDSKATANNTHAEGTNTVASNFEAHAEGKNTTASGQRSHAEGHESKASGDASHAEGYSTVASGMYSHAEGYNTEASGERAHAEGRDSFATADDSHAEGFNTIASGIYSHAEGYSTTASKAGAHVEGSNSKASGNNSHAEGEFTTASGNNSHAEGSGTIASKTSSHAEGYNTEASGERAHAEGNTCKATANNCHAEGSKTVASKVDSHAEGNSTVASGQRSHAEGGGTIAASIHQHAQGKYNIEDSEVVYAHIVGNGASVNERSNAHTLDWQGNAWYQGSVTSNGADYAEFFEWLDGNPDNEDRVGLLVALDGEKIRLANADDEVLGIISGTAAVLGDNYECEWNGKYLTDDFGRVIYDMVEEFSDEIVGEDEEGNPITEKQSLGFFKHPRINPDYDPEQAYVNRSDRPEWDTVGMLGKLYLRDDGTCQVNGYATVGENGIATASSEKTNMRVLSRVNKNVVRVLLK